MNSKKPPKVANNCDSLCYGNTPSRNETSGIQFIRRKAFVRSITNPYPVSTDLNSTAISSTSVVEKLPLYSPPQNAINSIKNPFEQAWLMKEKLSQPMCSPSMFQKVSSPISKSAGFSWSIDDISALRPAQIDENPTQEFASWFSPDTESQVQDAIDKFFSSMSQDALESPAPKKIKCNVKTVACQTNLTFPPALPDEAEAELMAICQRYAYNADESMNSSTCSARRKILSVEIKTSCSEDEDSVDGDCMSDQESMTKFYAATPLRRPMTSPEDSPIRGDAMSDSDNGDFNDVSMNNPGDSPSR